MGTTAARALRAEVKVVREADPAEAAPVSETSFHIAADEAVFDGHYPGFPILPGVCLIECAHRSALETHPELSGGGWRLKAIESSRFLDPVYPDEEIRFELKWKRVEDGWQARVVGSNPRGESARIRLRYVPEEAAA